MQLCKSGEPVVFHDATLERMTGGDRRAVAEVAFSDLPVLADGARIPTLAAVLDACRHRVVNVELKGDGASRRALVAAVADVVRRSPAKDDVVFSSFYPALVVQIAAGLPRVPRAILVGTETPRLTTALPALMRPLVVAVHMQDELLTRRRIARFRRMGLRTVAWTVNEPSRARALVKDGVGWLITDQPGAIVRALADTVSDRR